MGFIGDIFGFIATPLYYAISGVLIAWHELFTALGLDPEGGAGWALSIIGLTLVIRAALIPLFVRQIKASRNMQLIQPKVRELQKKYGHDRERLAQETMKLYKDSGTNPFASCLPILLQMPIFFALFRLIDQAAKNGEGRGILSNEEAASLRDAELFGVPISPTFLGADGDVGVTRRGVTYSSHAATSLQLVDHHGPSHGSCKSIPDKAIAPGLLAVLLPSATSSLF